eukprot:2129219-Amphidinium_carterae.1
MECLQPTADHLQKHLLSLRAEVVSHVTRQINSMEAERPGANRRLTGGPQVGRNALDQRLNPLPQIQTHCESYARWKRRDPRSSNVNLNQKCLGCLHVSSKVLFEEEEAFESPVFHLRKMLRFPIALPCIICTSPCKRDWYARVFFGNQAYNALRIGRDNQKNLRGDACPERCAQCQVNNQGRVAPRFVLKHGTSNSCLATKESDAEANRDLEAQESHKWAASAS